MTELKCQLAMIKLLKKKIWMGSQNIISGAETCRGVQQRQFSLKKSFGFVSKSTTKTWRIRVSTPTPPLFLFLEFYLKRSISYLLAFQLHSWQLMALAFVIILPAMIYRWCESNNVENLLLRWSFSFCFDCGEIQFVLDIEPPGSSSGSEGSEIPRTFWHIFLRLIWVSSIPRARVIHVNLIIIDHDIDHGTSSAVLTQKGCNLKNVFIEI